MSEIRNRILGQHREDCFALHNSREGIWPTPWAFLETVQRRDAIGRTSSPKALGDRWWHVRCNDPRCTAAIAVNETDLLEQLPWENSDD